MEQEKTLRILQVAIQMEIDGREFYLRASQKSGNETGKALLASLAGEEDVHRQRFQEIYEALRARKVWPRVSLRANRGSRLQSILKGASKDIDTSGIQTELDAVKTAMDTENKTVDFYASQGETATGAEKDFYQALAAEERAHHQVLYDYYEYLKDPAAWFVTRERHSLDGG